tara:strand:+ start:326 stop:481 length:156 start_codon:yes stop_codon:yes gene_type:complete
MKIPDYNKMRIILSDDNNDYMQLSDDDILYEYTKIFGNRVPLTKKENKNGN